MDIDLSQIAEHLNDGNYYPVFFGLETICKQSESLEEMEVEKLLAKLLRDPFFSASIPPQEIAETTSLLAEKGVVVKTINPLITGCAQFPLVSPFKDEVTLHEFATSEGSYELIPETFTLECRENLFYQILALQEMIQCNLSLEEEAGNDTTILNFGVKLNIRTPLIPHKVKVKTIANNSVQFAALVAFFSGFTKIPVDAGFVFCGGFDKNGNVVKLEDAEQITGAIFSKRPGVKKIFIPESDSWSESEQDLLFQNPDRIIRIGSLRELIEKVFGKSLKKLLKFPEEILHDLGTERIITTLLGKKRFEIYHPGHTEFPPVVARQFDLILANFSIGKFTISNLKEIYMTIAPANNQLLILEGKIPLHIVVSYILNAKKIPGIIAVRYNMTDNFVIISSNHGEKNLIGKQFTYRLYY